jgi:hypothetical protein
MEISFWPTRRSLGSEGAPGAAGIPSMEIEALSVIGEAVMDMEFWS